MIRSQDVGRYKQTFLDRQQKKYAEDEKRRHTATDAVRAAILKCVNRYPSVNRVYLFGSVVRPGRFRSVSDVDVAVDGIGPREYFDFWREVEEGAPGWSIDLRDITRPSSFKERVLATGVLIHERENPRSQG